MANELLRFLNFLIYNNSVPRYTIYNIKVINVSDFQLFCVQQNHQYFFKILPLKILFKMFKSFDNHIIITITETI
jgi:hypothetical protein